MKTLVGLFRNSEDANRAINTLKEVGFEESALGIVVRDGVVETKHGAAGEAAKHFDAAGGARFGATEGTIVGGLTGLLLGVTAIGIPGIGPAITIGALATVLGAGAGGAAVGAVAGAATGGIVGALINLGVSEEEAQVYAEGVKRGGILITVQAKDEHTSVVKDILRQSNAVETNTHRNNWQPEGWERFDETGASLTLESPNLRNETVNNSLSRRKTMETQAGSNATTQSKDVTQQVREKASDVAGQAQQKAAQVADQTQQQAKSTATARKDQAVGELDNIAHAFHQTSQALRQQNKETVAQYTEKVAQQVERVSGYLDERDINQLLGEAEDFARRQPELFLGSAFVAGLLVGRFIKSSSQRREQAYYGQAEGRSYAGATYAGTYDQTVRTGQPANSYENERAWKGANNVRS